MSSALSDTSLEAFLPLAHEMADASGAVIAPYFRSPIAVDDKSDNSPVTAADREAESAIRAIIERHRPDDGIIGEEFGNSRTDAEFVWVIDPIDGTRSFITGRPIFGTLIALVRNGSPILGILDQPISGERWSAGPGQTTMLGDRAVRSRACPGLTGAVMATTSPHLFSESQKIRYDAVEAAAKDVVFGGDCYNYGLIAAGHVDLVVESGLKPFDYCALVPIVEKSGGVITHWNGDPVTVDSGETILAAGDPATHAEALRLLAG